MARHRPRQVAVGALGALGAIGAVGALGALGALGPQVRAQEPGPVPTFRSEIDYVQLPVRVLDARGEFVGGLTQADFQILEDGRPQAIAAFSVVDIPFLPPDTTVPAAPVEAIDTVASNEAPQVDGRVYLFVLDAFHTETDDTLKVRELMHEFIRERLGANDLAAISIVGGGRAQNFTRNRQLLHDAVDRFVGDFDADASFRVDQALNTIAGMAEWLGSIKGRRKALVLVTTSPICSLASPDCRESLQHALRSSMQSDVSIYAIDPRGLVTSRRSRSESANPNSTYGREGAYIEAPHEAAARAAFAETQSGSRGPMDGARYLAEESGGIAVMNTNDLERGIDRIVRDNSSYYLLGYRSTNGRTDGRFRRNDVKVARPDVRVVHRNGYFAARVADEAARRLSAGAPTANAELRDLARSPLPVGAMPLRVAAAPFLSAGASRVTVVVEMPFEGLRPATDDGRYRLDIGLSIGFLDREGKPVGRDDPNIELDIPLNAAPKVTRNGMRVASRITVPPGAYRLWVGAVQTRSGLRGSVMTEIDIPDFRRQPLALSGIAVSTSEARRIYTARTDELLDDIFGGPPVAHREFTAESELWLYGEIYDHRSEGGDVTADVTVKSEDGRIVHQTPFEPAPVQFGHLARIPLRELGPGAYTATVEAVSTSPARVSAARTVAFRVK